MMVGVVNEHGRLSERYEYTPYGQRITFSAVPLLSDFNWDGQVDIGDLGILAATGAGDSTWPPDDRAH